MTPKADNIKGGQETGAREGSDDPVQLPAIRDTSKTPTQHSATPGGDGLPERTTLPAVRPTPPQHSSKSATPGGAESTPASQGRGIRKASLKALASATTPAPAPTMDAKSSNENADPVPMPMGGGIAENGDAATEVPPAPRQDAHQAPARKQSQAGGGQRSFPRQNGNRRMSQGAENAVSSLLNKDTKLTLKSIDDTLRRSGLDPESNAKLGLELIRLRALTDINDMMQIENSSSFEIVQKAVGGSLAINDWEGFKTRIVQLAEETRREVSHTEGHVAEYIPELGEADPELFAVSVCTTDGQIFNYGDCDIDVSIQSGVKPLTYALACKEHGVNTVANYVGIEASGLSFNEVSLNAEQKPHNPMINAGAIMSASLVGMHDRPARRLDTIQRTFTALAGGMKLGFEKAVYLSESRTAYRNQALSYFMQSVNGFPAGVDPMEALDTYLQCCSVGVRVEHLSRIAATFANNGTSPLSGEKVLSNKVVDAAMTLMFTCGMYDYSGEWASKVGMPAKSGVSGIIYVIVPGVMGISVLAPPLDRRGNSSRGIDFCKRVLKEWRLGIFEQLVNGTVDFSVRGALKLNTPRKSNAELEGPDGHKTKTATATAAADSAHAADPKSKLSHADSKLARATAIFLRMKTVAARLLKLFRRFKSLSDASTGKLSKATMMRLLRQQNMEGNPSVLRQMKAVFRDRDALDSFDQLFLLDDDAVSSPTHAHASSEKKENGTKKKVAVRSTNHLVKVLLSGVAIKDFPRFRQSCTETYEQSKACWYQMQQQQQEEMEQQMEAGLSGSAVKNGKNNGATRPSRSAGGQHDGKPDGSISVPEGLCVSIVSVDGQELHFGDSTNVFPLKSLAKTLMYLYTMETFGEDAVLKLVGNEMTSLDPTGFNLNSAGKPFNAFMDGGCLCNCNLTLDRKSHNSFAEMHNFLAKLCGEKVGFNQMAYLNYKEQELKLRALSSYLQGMDCYGSHGGATSQSVEAFELYLEAQAIEMNTAKLATMAATIANKGVSPRTQQKVLSQTTAQEVMSALYTCGMNQFAGVWQFNLNVPASHSGQGALMAVVPNVMGIAIHGDSLNDYGISEIAIEFLLNLNSCYKLSIFTQLTSRDALSPNEDDDEEEEYVVSPTVTFKQFHFITAAANGDFAAVVKLLDENIEINVGDYDKRTALHLACANDKVEICELLLEHGADPFILDRWNICAVDEARQQANASFNQGIPSTNVTQNDTAGSRASDDMRRVPSYGGFKEIGNHVNVQMTNECLQLLERFHGAQVTNYVSKASQLHMMMAKPRRVVGRAVGGGGEGTHKVGGTHRAPSRAIH